jgi:hypothetical protein
MDIACVRAEVMFRGLSSLYHPPNSTQLYFILVTVFLSPSYSNSSHAAKFKNTLSTRRADEHARYPPEAEEAQSSRSSSPGRRTGSCLRSPIQTLVPSYDMVVGRDLHRKDTRRTQSGQCERDRSRRESGRP